MQSCKTTSLTANIPKYARIINSKLRSLSTHHATSMPLPTHMRRLSFVHCLSSHFNNIPHQRHNANLRSTIMNIFRSLPQLPLQQYPTNGNPRYQLSCQWTFLTSTPVLHDDIFDSKYSKVVPITTFTKYPPCYAATHTHVTTNRSMHLLHSLPQLPLQQYPPSTLSHWQINDDHESPSLIASARTSTISPTNRNPRYK